MSAARRGASRRAPVSSASASALASAAALSLALAGCAKTPAPGEVQDHPSPQAQVMPAPLANAQAVDSSIVEVDAGPDAGPPAVPLRAGEVLRADVAPTKESPAHVVELWFHTAESTGTPKLPEHNPAGIDLAKRRVERRARVELSQTRMRLQPEGQGFVFPRDLELRARADRLGHIAVLGTRYRALAPGTLRALFADRRLDVGPLDQAEVSSKGEGPRRLGARTRRVEITARSAIVTLDLAHVADVGEGGVLLCRFLLDLANALPRTPACALEDVPLYAEFRWSTQGTLIIEASSFARRPDVLSSSLLAPPPLTAPSGELFPRERAGRMLSPQELRALRHGDPTSNATLDLSNPTTGLSVVWLDGLPVAWVGAYGQLALDGLAPGRYQVAWRSALGDTASTSEAVAAPGAAALGGLADAGREAGK
ncbi:MAG: hypothetical protein IPF92_08460 [Myxococcales bacterium]|nr:hypothetical protein [Myxococcales bacterium]HQY61815.1 hypothetical protein [Polyangiaceae bacterium]